MYTLAALLLSSPRLDWRTESHHSRLRREGSRCFQVTASNSEWTAEEDKELIEQLPFFTVGEGRSRVTFWSALATSNSVLSAKSPDLCQKRVEVLCNSNLPSQTIQGNFGPQPALLNNWKQFDSTRYIGAVDGRSVWLTVEMEGRLRSDPRAGYGYIVAVGGRVFELGVPDADEQKIIAAESLSTLLTERRDAMVAVLLALGCAVVSGFKGLDQVAQVAKSVELSPEVPRVCLTVSELYARQKLQVETDEWLLWLTETNSNEEVEKDLQSYHSRHKNVPLFQDITASQQALLKQLSLDEARLAQLKDNREEFELGDNVKRCGDSLCYTPGKLTTATWMSASTTTSSLTAFTDSEGQWAPEDRYYTRTSNTLLDQLSKATERVAIAEVRLERLQPSQHADRSWLLIEIKRAKQNLLELERAQAQMTERGQGPAVEMGQWEYT